MNEEHPLRGGVRASMKLGGVVADEVSTGPEVIELGIVATLELPPATQQSDMRAPLRESTGLTLEHEDRQVQLQEQRLLARLFSVEEESVRLGHYELQAELGRGGMGVVYVAHDTKLDRKVAIKELHAGRSGMQRRLIREALAMAKLAHPNVVPIYEIDEREGATFIVMEFIEGQTLREWQASERTQSEILAVYKSAARGLIAAHDKRLVHRDFKPDNVMVGADGRVRVMDFGLASVGAEPIERDTVGQPIGERSVFGPLTQTGAILGTPAYMPPEQFRAEPADAASDQFSFCVALYEALYGHRPFVAKTVDQLIAAMAREEIRAAPSGTLVPSGLRDLLCRGLSAKPEDRFESMQALLDALIAEELAHDQDLREPPAYLFVVHDDRDKLAVLRLCEGLLDRGVRPWLDMWELEPGRSWRSPIEGALAGAPAVLICGGESPGELAYAEALRARVEQDASSIYHVRFRDQHERGGPAQGIVLDEAGWEDGVIEIARRVGVDHEREDWLDIEARRADLEPEQLSPYRGLEAFREQDARWMFGREREVGALLDQLRADQTRFLTLVGASGSGKSSLLMGGVCPALRNGALGDGRDWTIAYLRPGPRPCEALAHALVGLDRVENSVEHMSRVTRLRAEFLEGTETLRLVMRGRGQGRTLLVVDQLEELFTEARFGERGESPEAHPFISNLLEATHERGGVDGRIWIAATLRADFVQRALEVPELARALQGGTYFALPPMSEEQIRAAIERPASRVGYRVERTLVDTLVAGAARQAGQLPLLQHVLRELWTRRDERGRMLRYATYARTGGLEGAIAVAAERALDDLRDELGHEGERVTRRLMTRLVHLGSRTAEDTRRRVPVERLREDAATRRVLEVFVRSARVLVATEANGVETVEFAHEALLREWTTLVEWLDADRDALRLRQELARVAAQSQGHMSGEYLWGRGRTEEARRLLAASVVELDQAERSFLEASEEALRRRRWWVRGGIAASVAAVLTVAAIVVVVVLGQKAEVERKNERAERARAEAEGARADAEAARIEAEGASARARQAKGLAEKTQKENERSVRQMFGVALRPVTEQLAEHRVAAGVVELDGRWTPLLERGGRTVVAASIGESFRVVVAGHEGVIGDPEEAGSSLFLETAIEWLLADQARRTVGIVTQQPSRYPRLEALQRSLLELEHVHEIVANLSDADALEGVGMLILDNRQVEAFSAEELATIEAFIARGGGVLAMGRGQSWLATESLGDGVELTLDSYPMNTAFAPLGVRWTEGGVQPQELQQRDEVAIVRFKNSLGLEVDLYVRSSGEREEYYTTLVAKETRELRTQIGSEWTFRRAADDHELDSARIEDEEQTLVISDEVAKQVARTTKAAKTKRAPEPKQPDEKPAKNNPAPVRKLLTRADVETEFNQANRAVKSCGRATLMSAVDAKIKVAPDGTIASLKFLPPATGSLEAMCAEKVISKLRFPTSREGGSFEWKLKLY